MNIVMWNPVEHSDDENTRYCWLRAVEWIVWPEFISQPIVPVMLLFWPWRTVVLTVLACNLFWNLSITRAVVIWWLADLGPFFVRLKWIVCPVMGIYFYSTGQTANAWIALLWPLLVFVVAVIPGINLLLVLLIRPISAVGQVQRMFMTALGINVEFDPKDDNQARTTIGIAKLKFPAKAERTTMTLEQFAAKYGAEVENAGPLYGSLKSIVSHGNSIFQLETGEFRVMILTFGRLERWLIERKLSKAGIPVRKKSTFERPYRDKDVVGTFDPNNEQQAMFVLELVRSHVSRL